MASCCTATEHNGNMSLNTKLYRDLQNEAKVEAKLEQERSYMSTECLKSSANIRYKIAVQTIKTNK